jgi:hypothetical protein
MVAWSHAIGILADLAADSLHEIRMCPEGIRGEESGLGNLFRRASTLSTSEIEGTVLRRPEANGP